MEYRTLAAAACAFRWRDWAATTSAAASISRRPKRWWPQRSTRASPSSIRRASAATANRGVPGQALGSRRKDVVIATKFGMERDDPESGGSRRYVMSAVETSLKALGTDWIDLYQLHQSDPRTPIEETLDALDTLVDQGNARYAGCSNCMGWQIADAQWTAIQHGFRRFVSAQNQWGLLHRDIETEVVAGVRTLRNWCPAVLSARLGVSHRQSQARAETSTGQSAVRRSVCHAAHRFELRHARSPRGVGSCARAVAPRDRVGMAGQPAGGFPVIAGATKPETIACQRRRDHDRFWWRRDPRARRTRRFLAADLSPGGDGRQTPIGVGRPPVTVSRMRPGASSLFPRIVTALSGRTPGL